VDETGLQFEWDEDKAASNLIKHGVCFDRVTALFENPLIERIDDQEDYGETRLIAIGRVDFDVYRIVYTWSEENVVRIISAQKASKHEQEIYYRKVFS